MFARDWPPELRLDVTRDSEILPGGGHTLFVRRETDGEKAVRLATADSEFVLIHRSMLAHITFDPTPK